MALTPEQIASAQTPQQMAVSGANNTPITPSALTPATAAQPTIPAPIAAPTVPDFLQTTQQEQQATDQYAGISQQIAALTGDLAGRDAYTTGQQQQQDIIGKQGAVANYQNQLKALQQEQQGISLQREQNIQAKQQAMSGQGIAAPIVARHSAIDTQYNQQTLTNAVKQYSIGAQLSAAQGDLTSALNYVDQAVKLKYQPIEAQLTAQQANLQAIQNSPNFTSAQKKQAAALELQNKTYLDSIATEKENAKSVQALALQALQNGAPEPIVNKIYNSKDLGEAMGYATGYAQKETATSIQEYNFAVRNGYKGSFSQYQDEDANRKKAIARAGVANGEFGLSQGQANLFNNIITKYNASPLIAAADRTIVLKNSIEQARKNPSDGATQLNLVYSYIQALDTYQSAVREGELGLVNSIDSKIGALSNSVSQIQNGQIVRPEVAKQIADAADNLVNTINQGAKSKAKSFESQANTLGLGEPWKKYQSGFQSSFADKTPQQKVEEAVQSSGKTYQQLISSAPKGQIAIVRDGVAGYIPVEEYNPSTDVKM